MEKKVEEIINAALSTNAEKVFLYTETKVEMNKKGNPLYESNVTKKVKGEYFFNRSYRDMVNEALQSDGCNTTFQSQSLPWGEWYENGENRVIKHVNKAGETNYYLRYYIDNDETGEMEFFVDGKPATKDELETINKFAKVKSGGSKAQSEAGVAKEKEVRPLIVNINNIIEYEFK